MKTALFVLLILGLLFVSSCAETISHRESPPKRETPGNPEQPKPLNTLTDADVLIEAKNVVLMNMIHNFNPEDYPQVIGIHDKNDKKLIESYYCEDLCGPGKGFIALTYQGVTQEECDRIGGQNILYGFAYGKNYLGCAPRLFDTMPEPRLEHHPSSLTDADLQEVAHQLDQINSDNLHINPQDYPKTLGIYNSRVLELNYFCSDVCPGSGSVGLYYRGISTKTDCDVIGGKNVIDPAWGGYRGCSPL